jgi:hypothetical protein
MKQLILPIIIGLLAGLGGGSGYAYMQASAQFVTDSTKYAEQAAADSAARDSVVKDSLARLAPPAPVDEALLHPLTPADSIRALLAARELLKGGGAPQVTPATTRHGDATRPAAKGNDAKAHEAPAAHAPPPPPPPAPSSTPVAAVAVNGARDEALLDPIPEQRLAKIFAAMPAKEAAKVLDQMSDKDVRSILGLMSDRQAAAILPLLPPGRAATITRGAAKAPEKTP